MPLNRPEFDKYVASIAGIEMPSFSEADTRAYLIDPLLRLLGYDSPEHVRREVPVPATKEYLDYELRAGGRAVAIVEAKALRHAVSDQHAAQCVQYASVLGVRWCLVTNGLAWAIYDGHATGSLTEKKLAEVSLVGSAWGLDFAWRVMSDFSREKIELAGGSKLVMERVIRDELARPDSPAVKALQKAMRVRIGQPVRADVIVDAISRLTSIGRMGPTTPENTGQPNVFKTPKAAGTGGGPVDEDKTQRLPMGFTGNIGKVMLKDRYGKKQGEFLLVHAAADGKTRCGNDTIGPGDDGILAWQATTEAVTCGRCLRRNRL